MHEFYGEEYFQNILNMILLILCNTNLPYKRGHFIDYQDFFLQVYPMGKNVNIEINANQYQEIIQELQIELKRYQLKFYDNSNISFSIAPKVPKSFCLQYIQHFNEIHYFGKLETCNKKIKIHKDLTFLQNIIN